MSWRRGRANIASYGLAQTVEDNLLIISGLVLAEVLQSIGDSMAAVYGKGLGHSRAEWHETRRSHADGLCADIERRSIGFQHIQGSGANREVRAVRVDLGDVRTDE